MKKKFILLTLIIILLCGCNGNPEPADSSAQLQTAAPSPQEIDTSALSNKKEGWGFRKIANSRPEFTKGQISAMENYGCIYMGADGEKSVYLTFDEGYENGYTEAILDTLKMYNVKAAFFITGPYLKEHGDIVDKMVADGHIVGNHTINHPSLPDKTEEEIISETDGLDRLFYKKYGFNMKYMRPPMGEYSEKTLAITKNMGYINVFWSFAYRDWETDNQKGTQYAFEQVTKGLHCGAVILLHAVSKDNSAALGDIIRYAQDMGYQFKTLDEYK